MSMVRPSGESAPPGAPFRFLVAGAVNTVLTLVLYLMLLDFVSHPVAYTSAFVVGIAISYLLNRSFVFRAKGGLQTVVLFPVVYVAQYLVGLVVVLLWVDVLGWPASMASIAAVVVTIPLTYVLSRRIFVRHRDGPAAAHGQVAGPDR
jgi:putative flippase GtrA